MTRQQTWQQFAAIFHKTILTLLILLLTIFFKHAQAH